VTRRTRGIIVIIQNRWLMLAVLFVARTTTALQFQTVASTGPFLIDALAIEFTALGALIGLYMLPGVVIALPGGMLGQRFGARHVVFAGLALMTLGSALMGVNSSFAGAMAGRVIAGTGAVLLNVMFTKMIADWFAGREIVTAMAILVTSWPFGLAIGLLAFGPLAAAQGWRAVMYLGAIAAFAALVLVAALYRDPPDAPPDGPARLVLNLTRREWILVLISATIWGFMNVGYIIIISFTPDLFVARGYSLPEASAIVSVIGWVLIPSIPVAGFLIERTGRPMLCMLGGFGIATVAAFALPFVTMPLIAFGFLVFAIGVPAGMIMALPAQSLRPESRATGMGIFFTCYYLMFAVLPGGAGLARDLSGSPAAPVVFAAAMMLLCVLGLMLFHAAKRIPEQ
jgi:predicted MFS family arabinose efflux permease